MSQIKVVNVNIITILITIIIKYQDNRVYTLLYRTKENFSNYSLQNMKNLLGGNFSMLSYPKSQLEISLTK